MPGGYRVVILPSARRELQGLHQPLLGRVAVAISALSDNPRPHGCRKLENSESDYRIRIGDHRVLYEVSDAEKIINVYRVRHRSKAYL